MQVGGELRGDHAAAPGVAEHAPYERLLHARLAGGAALREDVGGVAHHQVHALIACSRQPQPRGRQRLCMQKARRFGGSETQQP